MKREDFIFTLGYMGNASLVDSRAKKKFASLSTMELAEKGLYKPAFCSALYSGDSQELEQLMELLKDRFDLEEANVERFKRLFGVFGVPDNIGRVITV
ncbi:MAG: hypothetical protein ACLFST_12935 [Spirochaetia bacterium]